MLVSICFFLSGAAALVLQVLWVRMLGHVFGATALAVSTTLTAFMGGLALGAFVAGKRAPSLKHPLRVFALLETAVGIYGLFVPALFGLLPAVQRMISPDSGLGFVGYSLLRFVVVTLILILPTTAMGATLPILAEGVVKKQTEMASRVGELYAANTAGAVVGALLGGFYLIPTFGLETTVYIGAAMDLSVAAIVLLLARGGEETLTRRRLERSTDSVLADIVPVEVVDATPRTVRVAVLAFALSGAAAMALEVLWTRAVGVVIGASTYAFTLILATFLVGLAGGAAILTRYVDRIASPVAWLARVQVAVGVLAMLGMVLVDRLPHLLHGTMLDADVTIAGLYATKFFIAVLVIIPATLLLGTVMPLVVRILAPKGEAHAGPIVGRAYTWNTFGAIGGSFAGGFILLPLVGVQTGITLAAALSIAVGLMLALTRQPRDGVTVVAALIALPLIFAAPKWNVSSWTSGLFRVYLAREVFEDGWEASGTLVYHRDGISTTVTVERANDGEGVWLKVNGKVDASDIGDMPTQVLSGLLPVLVHGSAKELLVIGYGSGVTPGAALQAPVDQVVLVELEEAVVEASNKFFSHVNHAPATDPRFEAVVDDGRNYLLTRDDTFDVIISEPSNPWMSGASSLFTQDFFQIAKTRLRKDGVFLQWLQLYELSPKNIHALLRTFQSVFPYVMVFTPNPTSNDTLLIGADHPVWLDRAIIQRALDDPRLGAELARANIETPADFIGLFVVGYDELPKYIGKGPINTDDNAMIEFGAPRDLLEYSVSDARLPFVDDIAGKRHKTTPKYFKGFDFTGSSTTALIAERLTRQGRGEDARQFVSLARTTLPPTASATLTDRLDRIQSMLDRLDEAAAEPVIVDSPETREERYARVALAIVNGKEQRALDLADSPDGFEDLSSGHRFLYAYLCYRFERYIDAEFLIEPVIEDAAFIAAHPEALYYAARIYAERGKHPRSIDVLGRFLDWKKTSAPQP